MKLGSFRTHLAWCVGLLGLAGLVVASGCGPELDRISKLNTLRILALKKSAPYARPGETVKLQLLWEDAGAARARPVQRFIGFWCVNPVGNLFQQCLTATPSVTPQFAFNQDEFSITLPEDILQPSAIEPNLPPSGVAFVFYGVCAGELAIGDQPLNLGQGGAPQLGAGGDAGFSQVAEIPTCLDEQGDPLGSNDFVVGYSAIYAYKDLRNQNPILTGFRVNDQDVTVDCMDDDCVGSSFKEPQDCEAGVACIETCADDGKIPCPEIAITPLVDRKSVEKDEVAQVSYGTELEESLWVSYFTNRGGVKGDVRLINDATTGWNPSYGTALYAPREPGPLYIWAVVRDNRGGAAWVRVPAYARAPR